MQVYFHDLYAILNETVRAGNLRDSAAAWGTCGQGQHTKHSEEKQHWLLSTRQWRGTKRPGSEVKTTLLGHVPHHWPQSVRLTTMYNTANVRWQGTGVFLKTGNARRSLLSPIFEAGHRLHSKCPPYIHSLLQGTDVEKADCSGLPGLPQLTDLSLHLLCSITLCPTVSTPSNVT